MGTGDRARVDSLQAAPCGAQIGARGTEVWEGARVRQFGTGRADGAEQRRRNSSAARRNAPGTRLRDHLPHWYHPPPLLLSQLFASGSRNTVRLRTTPAIPHLPGGANAIKVRVLRAPRHRPDDAAHADPDPRRGPGPAVVGEMSVPAIVSID